MACLTSAGSMVLCRQGTPTSSTVARALQGHYAWKNLEQLLGL